MIRAEEIKNKIEVVAQQKKSKIEEYDEKLTYSIFQRIEREITKKLENNKIENKYYFNIPLEVRSSFWDPEYMVVAATRDNKILKSVTELLDAHLKSHGWKNIKIKTYNFWYPMIPAIKVWMEI